MTSIPFFRYHPDPFATGSAEASDAACVVCIERTGFRYVGPVVGGKAGDVCLGCIASGAVGALTDLWGIPDGVPLAVLEELEQRTPSYYAWQDTRWLFHCNDGAAYLGRIGWTQLQHDPAALESLYQEAREFGVDEAQAHDRLTNLTPDGDLTAYLFECLHCATHLAYSDAN
ncbi:CbrC family protein [Kribbella sp. NBC_01505]|uniref:CbrC family protein n=1 Tax=Kribbella sp. NBC_01505 TaxID=2903580 RepID=UPI00386F2B16